MSNSYQIIDVVDDGEGDAIEVAVIPATGKVLLSIDVEDACGIVALNAEQRDRFAKAWAEAERRAVAHGAQAGACGCPDTTRCGHADAADPRGDGEPGA